MKLVRRLSVGLLVVVTLALVTSCAAPSGPLSVRQPARASARLALKERSAYRKRLAVAADGGGDMVRLGLVPGLADAAGLVGAELGYFQQELGATARLQVVTFSSEGAEEAALAAGRLDAAYVNPVTAVHVWLASDRRLIKVIAGAAARRSRPRGGAASALLVVTTTLLRTRAALVGAMLRGQIRAVQLLDTDPARALGVIGAELAALRAPGLRRELLVRSFARVSYTNDPLVRSVLAQAEHAAALGAVRPLPSSMAGLFDLGPLNKLLRAAGQSAVPG